MTNVKKKLQSIVKYLPHILYNHGCSPHPASNIEFHLEKKNGRPNVILVVLGAHYICKLHVKV